MNSFVHFAFLFAVVACTAYAVLDDTLSEDVIASYVEAFEQYQTKFNKHYDTKAEYDKRLRAYAVCWHQFFQDK